MTTGYTEVMTSIGAFEARKEAGALALCKLYGAKCGAYAQNNARWEDHTCHARQSLWGNAKRDGENIMVFCAHVMFYGIFLELCNAGNYAILEEAIKHDVDSLYQELRIFMNTVY